MMEHVIQKREKMEQKNTIVKCNHSPECLFEHNGICNNYVINIGADGQCACYVETVVASIQDELLRQQMCWYCDNNGFDGNCNLTAKPSLDRNGKCPRFTSTGGNR